MSLDVENIRTALILTLSVLLVAVLWRRFKMNVMAKDMPAVLHTELIDLQVVYHPARLHVIVKVPGNQILTSELLNSAHEPVHRWPEQHLERGETTFELALPPLSDGQYHLEVRTATQRTTRQFRLKQG